MCALTLDESREREREPQENAQTGIQSDELIKQVQPIFQSTVLIPLPFHERREREAGIRSGEHTDRRADQAGVVSVQYTIAR